MKASPQTTTVQPPTAALIEGELGPPIVVLSRSEIRAAEVCSIAARYQTLDGWVEGRTDDVVITAAGGERFPILADVFHGAYEELWIVGHTRVARRLAHERLAWPIVSEQALFNYGSDRGTVAVARGAWLYETDEGEFGTISATAHATSHLVVGPVSEQTHANWNQRFRTGMNILAVLPPLMALLALMALVQAFHLSAHWLVMETVLLVAGTALGWWMKSQRWPLRALVETASRTAREFQCAVELLGKRPSTRFPGQALWRAAQATDESSAPACTGSGLSAEKLLQLQKLIGQTLAHLRHESHRLERRERLAQWGTVGAAAVAFACNLYILFVAHALPPEMLAILLPTVIAAVHADNSRRQVADGHLALLDFATQLRFAQEQLLALGTAETRAEQKQSLRAALRLVCKVVGQHQQYLLRRGLAEQPAPPV